jgi:hypothetical protein
VFENRLPREIFGSKRREVIGYWRKLHNEKLHNLYSSSNIIRVIKSRRMTWIEHVKCTEEMRNVHKILAAKPEWRKPSGRPRHR